MKNRHLEVEDVVENVCSETQYAEVVVGGCVRKKRAVQQTMLWKSWVVIYHYVRKKCVCAAHHAVENLGCDTGLSAENECCVTHNVVENMGCERGLSAEKASFVSAEHSSFGSAFPP